MSFKVGNGGVLCTIVAVPGDEEYGEKNDLGSLPITSSESESAGVIVGGAGPTQEIGTTL